MSWNYEDDYIAGIEDRWGVNDPQEEEGIGETCYSCGHPIESGFGGEGFCPFGDACTEVIGLATVLEALAKDMAEGRFINLDRFDEAIRLLHYERPRVRDLEARHFVMVRLWKAGELGHEEMFVIFLDQMAASLRKEGEIHPQDLADWKGLLRAL